jgi:hypothetical protein
VSAVRKEAAAPAGLSPERQALAAAIEARNTYNAEKAAAEAGLRELTRQVSDAYGARGQAREAMETAQVAGVAHLVDVASGRAAAGTAPVTAKEARDAMAEAEDRLAMLKQAEAAMLARVGEMHKPFSSPQEKVKDAARAVLRSEIDVQTFFADIKKLQDELVEKRLVLCALAQFHVLPEEGNPNKDWVVPTTRAGNMNFVPAEWQNNPAPVWGDAFEALLEDPTTLLPPIDKANL